MRLFLFTHSFPYLPGEEFIATELPYLAEQFDSITVVPCNLSDAQRPTPPEVRIDTSLAACLSSRRLLRNFPSLSRVGLRAEFFRALASQDLATRWNPRVVRGTLAHWLRASATYQWLVQRKADLAPNDLFYSYWFSDSTTALAHFSRTQRKIALVSRCHGHDVYAERVPGGVFPFREMTLDAIEAVFPCSGHGERYLRDRYPQWGQKFEVSRLGVARSSHLAPWQHREDTLRVVSCAYVSAVKRLDKLCDALGWIVSQPGSPQITWTHFGAGPLFDQLVQQAASVSSLNVDFRGATSNRDLLSCYANEPFDVFVNCSDSEGLPVSIMESLSHGIPVVAPDVGGISELIDRENGALMPAPCTSDDIVAGIDQVIGGGKAMRTNAQESWAQMVSAEKNFRQFTDRLAAIFAHTSGQELVEVRRCG